MELHVISGLGDGIPVARLDVAADACAQVRQVDNNDTLSLSIRWPAPLLVRDPIRLTRDDGRVFEYRVTNIVVDDSRVQARVDAAGPWASIAKAGFIRTVIDGAPVYTFSDEGSISELLTAHFLPNLAVDGLDWIDDTLGPIEDDARCTVDFTAENRAQLVQRIVEQTGYEPYLTQVSPGAKYQLAFAVRRGADAPGLTVATDTNLLTYGSAQNDAEILTQVTPFGDVPEGGVERATIRENSWEVSVIDSEWAALLDPMGLVIPIAFDGALNGTWLQFATTTTPVRREILASRVSDQAVKLSSTTTLNTAGLQVTIVADANGAPLTTLWNPAGVNTYGLVTDKEEVSGGRGERNFVPNAQFTAGASTWNAGASGWVEAHPATDTVDLVGLVNGSVSPGGSSLVVDGFPANAVIRKGEMLRTEGTQLCVAPSGSGHTIKSDGKATISTTLLAYSITDGQTLTMTAFDPNGVKVQQSVVVDGNQSGGATSLTLKSFATVTRKLTTGDKIEFQLGGVYVGTSTNNLKLTNDTASPIVRRVTVQLTPSSFSDAALTPSSTNLTAGDAVTLTLLSGATFSASVVSDFTNGSTSLTLDITIEATGSFNQGVATSGSPATITAVKTDYTTVTVTTSTVEWSESGVLTANWSGGLAHSYTAARAKWMTSASVLIDYLTIVSGAGASATSAVLLYGTRARIYPLAVFDNGSVGADLLFCGTTTTLNGSGAGTIPLMFGNANTLNDNAGVRVFRNIYGWNDAAPLRNVLRAVNGATSNTFVVTIPGSAAETATATIVAALFVPVGTNFFSSKTPTPNIFPVTIEVRDPVGPVVYSNTVNVPVPAAYATDERPVPVVFSMTQQFPVTANRSLTVKLSAADASHLNVLINLMPLHASVMLTAETDIPFTPTSHANRLWQRGTRRLQLADMATAPVTGTVVDLSQIRGAQLVPQTVELGQDVYIRDIDDTQRALRITCDPRQPALLDIGFDRDRPFFEELVA